jgi:hypothetical protein
MIEGSTGSGGRGRPWQTRDRIRVAARCLVDSARQSATPTTCLLSSTCSTQSLVSQYLPSRSDSLALQLARLISRLSPEPYYQHNRESPPRRLHTSTHNEARRICFQCLDMVRPPDSSLPGCMLTLRQRCHLRLRHRHPLRHWCSLQDKQPLHDGL